MFLKGKIMTSTKDYSANIKRLKEELQKADAILIGAGAGLSVSAGLTYSGKRFYQHFADFHKKYGITDMYSGGFYPYSTLEEYWAWWSRHISINRYDVEVGRVYKDLLSIVKNMDYFVLTTNVDHQFQMAGFEKKRLFYTQGDYGLWQCSKACHPKTYDNEESIRKMLAAQKNMKIPTKLIPHCPICGEPMAMNLRCDDTFVQEEGWYAAADRYNDFVRRHKDFRILFLELGVGVNTPSIIKFSFWQMVHEWSNATYACINLNEAFAPEEISRKSICINDDIEAVLMQL